VLQRLSLDMDDRQLAVAAFWLDHCDEAGYRWRRWTSCSCWPAPSSTSPPTAWKPSAQLLHGEPAGMAAQDLREGLQAQLRCTASWPARHLAARILDGALDAAPRLPASPASTTPRSTTCARRLILSLQPRPGDSLLPERNAVVVPDVSPGTPMGSGRSH
jgi:RNA polymerase sigma-54 factor